MSDFGDFEIDDDLFAEGTGINKITKAYSKVFDNIIELAQQAKEFAEAGSAKEINSNINKIVSKVSALVQIEHLDKKIINSNGTIMNVFGEEEYDYDDDCETMSENDLVDELDKIVQGCSSIDMNDIEFDSAKNNTNIEDDGEDHGDLDFIW